MVIDKERYVELAMGVPCNSASPISPPLPLQIPSPKGDHDTKAE